MNSLKTNNIIGHFNRGTSLIISDHGGRQFIVRRPKNSSRKIATEFGAEISGYFGTTLEVDAPLVKQLIEESEDGQIFMIDNFVEKVVARVKQYNLDFPTATEEVIGLERQGYWLATENL